MAELKISPEMLQGPVPGMSLTSEPQQFPWEVPTQITTVEEAVEYYSERLMEDEDVEDALLMALDNGVSIERLAEMLTVSATMNGVHNLDVSFLINPYVREVMKLIAEGAGQNYVDSYSNAQKEKRIPYRLAKEVVEEVYEEKETVPEETIMAPPMKGLMAKPIGEAVDLTEAPVEDMETPTEEEEV
tara:strand:- start:5632 stop:6192 length:561 start_codon:yes stop_codon:yes gene_type:complete